MTARKNWIIIAGNGRNTGKTTLACQIISRNRQLDVIGIKISPHHHHVPEAAEIIMRNDGFCIIRETVNSTKDSSRMLQAGATDVFYVQCSDEAIADVLPHLDRLSAGRPVVCESGAIRTLVTPALFFMVMSEKNADKASARANLTYDPVVIDLETIRTAKTGHTILFINNHWKQTTIHDNL